MTKLIRYIRSRIIWKIMLIFWLTTICIILTNIFITTEIVMNENKVELLKNQVRQFAKESVAIYEADGTPGLSRWYRQTRKRYGLDFVLLDQNSEALGKRRDFDRKRIEKNAPPFPIHFQKLLLLLSQPYDSPSGNSYRLELLPSKKLIATFRPPGALNLYRLLSSFFFIFLGSWLIARSISKPVSILSKASLQVGQGNLKTRVGTDVGNRSDELGELARAFDHMTKRIERLLKAQQQLFSDISHDIRTPLTRQKLAIELARDTENPRSLLDKIEKQNQDIDRLLDDMLTIFKLEQNQDQSPPKPTNLSTLVTELLEQASIECQDKKLAMNANIDANVCVLGRENQLARAINNIISNAVKYSQSESKISVDLTCTGNKAALCIQDQGAGIPETEIEAVLQPFYRTDKSRDGDTGGYGLGLAIASKIIDEHHGRLTLENIHQCTDLPDSEHTGSNQTGSNQSVAGLKVTVTLPLK